MSLTVGAATTTGSSVLLSTTAGGSATSIVTAGAVLPLLKGASLVGVFWGGFAKQEPKKNAEMMQILAEWYGQGKIKPVIDSTLPLSNLKEAYARMGARNVKGKLVLMND